MNKFDYKKIDFANISLKFKKSIIILCTIAVCIGIVFLAVNFYVIKTTEKQIAENLDSNYDCILVLGAGVRNGSPSPMLKDRLDCAIELYKNGKSQKILMSGDHGQKDYDEVNIMKKYAIENGVKDEDVFMDHAGFSTYESVYRAKEVFKAEKIIIVTQKYHLYRAIYVANSLNLESVGMASNPREYSGQAYRDFREIFARNKDFIYCIFKPEPTYLGNAIPVSGNGNLTND